MALSYLYQVMSAKYDDVLMRMKEQGCEIKSLNKWLREIERQKHNETSKQLQHEVLEFYGTPNTNRVSGLKGKAGCQQLARARAIQGWSFSYPGAITRVASQQTGGKG